jgi:hypothetical protein
LSACCGLPTSVGREPEISVTRDSKPGVEIMTDGAQSAQTALTGTTSTPKAMSVAELEDLLSDP